MATINFSYIKDVSLPLNLGNSYIPLSGVNPVTVTIKVTDTTALQTARFNTSTVLSASSLWNTELGILSVYGDVADVNTLLSNLRFIPSENGTWYNMTFDVSAKDSNGSSLKSDQWIFTGSTNSSLLPSITPVSQSETVTSNTPTSLTHQLDLGRVTGPLPVYEYSVNVLDGQQLEVVTTNGGSISNTGAVGGFSFTPAVFDKVGAGSVFLSPNSRHMIEFTGNSGGNRTGYIKSSFQNGAWVTDFSGTTASAGITLTTNIDPNYVTLSNDGQYIAIRSGSGVTLSMRKITTGTWTAVTGALSVGNFDATTNSLQMVLTNLGSGTVTVEVRRGSGSVWSLSHSKVFSVLGTPNLTAVTYSVNNLMAIFKTSTNDFYHVTCDYTSNTITCVQIFNSTDTLGSITPQNDAVLTYSATTANIRTWNGSVWSSPTTIVTTTNIAMATTLGSRDRVAVLTGTTNPRTMTIHGRRSSDSVYAPITSNSAITGAFIGGGYDHNLVLINNNTSNWITTLSRPFPNNVVYQMNAPIDVINAANKQLYFKLNNTPSSATNHINVNVRDYNNPSFNYRVLIDVLASLSFELTPAIMNYINTDHSVTLPSGYTVYNTLDNLNDDGLETEYSDVRFYTKNTGNNIVSCLTKVTSSQYYIRYRDTASSWIGATLNLTGSLVSFECQSGMNLITHNGGKNAMINRITSSAGPRFDLPGSSTDNVWADAIQLVKPAKSWRISEDGSKIVRLRDTPSFGFTSSTINYGGSPAGLTNNYNASFSYIYAGSTVYPTVKSVAWVGNTTIIVLLDDPYKQGNPGSSENVYYAKVLYFSGSAWVDQPSLAFTIDKSVSTPFITDIKYGSDHILYNENNTIKKRVLSTGVTTTIISGVECGVFIGPGHIMAGSYDTIDNGSNTWDLYYIKEDDTTIIKTLVKRNVPRDVKYNYTLPAVGDQYATIRKTQSGPTVTSLGYRIVNP